MMTTLRQSAELPFDLPLWSCTFEQQNRVKVLTRADVEQRLIARALREPQFRQQLIAAAKPLAEAELGDTLPDAFCVEVLEDTATIRHLTIPHNPLEKGFEGWSLEEAAEWALEGLRTALLNPAQARALVVRVWTDEAYRERLVTTPNALLERDFCICIAPETTIHVKMETPDLVFLVIPDLFGYSEWECEDAEFVSIVNQPIIIGSQLPLPTTSVNC